jgi:hypothetical protein
MNSSDRPRRETLLIVGAPLVLAVVELFHPYPHDLFQLPLPRWLAIHYLQILLFPLSALAVAASVRGLGGVAAALCRAGMFVFAVSFVAFDTAAGVVTALLVQAAQASGNPEAWRAPVLAIWAHPVVGGAPGSTPVLAVAGTAAWLVGALAAAVAIRRAGASWMPVALFAVAALGLFVFKSHAWPGGPLSFGAAAAGGAWWRWQRMGTS